jgi:hypothetical protein
MNVRVAQFVTRVFFDRNFLEWILVLFIAVSGSWPLKKSEGLLLERFGRKNTLGHQGPEI